jgi:hypothetical protein
MHWTQWFSHWNFNGRNYWFPVVPLSTVTNNCRSKIILASSISHDTTVPLICNVHITGSTSLILSFSGCTYVSVEFRTVCGQLTLGIYIFGVCAVAPQIYWSTVTQERFRDTLPHGREDLIPSNMYHHTDDPCPRKRCDCLLGARGFILAQAC